MRTLFYYPGNASMAPHILLEELQQPFGLKLVDRAHDQHKSADYLRLNPNGLIPVLLDGDLVLYETAAVCLHLADSDPPSGLAPPVGSASRAQLYKWLMWLTNTLQATLLLYFYPERWVDAGNVEAARQVRAHAEARVGGLLDQIERQLLDSGGPWMLGDQYTLLDPYVMMLARWTRNFARPARDLPVLGQHLGRVLGRPAVQRALASEGLTAPWV